MGQADTTVTGSNSTVIMSGSCSNDREGQKERKGRGNEPHSIKIEEGRKMMEGGERKLGGRVEGENKPSERKGAKALG